MFLEDFLCIAKEGEVTGHVAENIEMSCDESHEFTEELRWISC